jgi:hypothetical protein
VKWLSVPALYKVRRQIFMNEKEALNLKVEKTKTLIGLKDKLDEFINNSISDLISEKKYDTREGIDGAMSTVQESLLLLINETKFR